MRNSARTKLGNSHEPQNRQKTSNYFKTITCVKSSAYRGRGSVGTCKTRLNHPNVFGFGVSFKDWTSELLGNFTHHILRISKGQQCTNTRSLCTPFILNKHVPGLHNRARLCLTTGCHAKDSDSSTWWVLIEPSVYMRTSDQSRMSTDRFIWKTCFDFSREHENEQATKYVDVQGGEWATEYSHKGLPDWFINWVNWCVRAWVSEWVSVNKQVRESVSQSVDFQRYLTPPFISFRMQTGYDKQTGEMLHRKGCSQQSAGMKNCRFQLHQHVRLKND